ncbi:HAD-IA family hydrolase [Falsiroseomonas sp. HC035]|uniref:HAD-IA family hydrolase n=1 Tax=Falsiroseomonas sp. HC035 TaxID=3390999 RepID=UPI003D3110CA
MTVRALIFDCDGTLVDSEPLGAAVFAEALAELGLALTAEAALARFRGRRLATTLAEVGGLLGHALPADFEARLRDRTALALRAGLREIAGAAALVRALTLPFCVASNAPRAKIELNLELTGLRPHFGDRIFSAYEVGSWKPDPGLFLHAADALAIPPDACLVIEDSEAGVVAALAAGMPVLALLPEGDAAWRPRHVPAIRQLSEVAAYLGSAG